MSYGLWCTCRYIQWDLMPSTALHDNVIKWKHSQRYWPFVRGIHRSPVNSPHKGQWRGDLMVFFIRAGINGWVNNREAGDLRRHRGHYDVTVMPIELQLIWLPMRQSGLSNSSGGEQRRFHNQAKFNRSRTYQIDLISNNNLYYSCSQDAKYLLRIW